MGRSLVRKRRKHIGLGLFLGIISFAILANFLVSQVSQSRIYSSVGAAPKHRVGVVLGTAPYYGERKNLYFWSRIEAATRLYKSGKVERLLVSGDNGRRDYSEPDEMFAALVKAGVPSSAITKDCAGFRTLDTVVRAHRVFGLADCVFITDDFHMPRTLYLADHEGLRADGFVGDHVPIEASPQTHVREIGARTLVVLDVLLGRGPRYLGPPVPIP